MLLLVVLSSCKPDAPAPTPTSTQGVLPTPQVFTTRTPKLSAAVQAFLDAWKAGDYAAMYARLSKDSRAAITAEDFAARYADATNEAAMTDLKVTLLGEQNSAPKGSVSVQTTLVSAIVGEITRQYTYPLVLEEGQWRIQWSDGLILPELANGNVLRMDSGQPSRSAIYDRSGNPIAKQADAVAVGVWPGYVSIEDDQGLVSLLAQLSNRRFEQIASWIEATPPGQYLPITEAPADENTNLLEALVGWNAAQVTRYSRRLYWGNGIAPHMVGYVSAVQEDEVGAYRRKGYRSDERVGRKGIELWGEDTLMGKRGGTLYVFNQDGAPVSELGSAPSSPGQDIYTTIDRQYQYDAQRALAGFTGAAVVLELDTGRVLAMVSSPGFDPNAFEIENFNWNTELNLIVNNPEQPQFNRAAQGQYPLGSVFKIITFAAALESTRYTADTTYDCQYTFDEIPGFVRYDWTWDHFQEDEVTQPSGVLTMPETLMRSCNPFFWHIGLDLYRVGMTKNIAEMSRAFGLGSPTGIVGVDEEPGNIPEPGSEIDAINLAIGQGDMQVTPLQVARFVAAVGNGGTLYRPQVIEKIVGPDGVVSASFEPDAQGVLPVKPENLALIQQAMLGVVRSKQPVGTAYRPMNGLDIAVAGKTGTATTGSIPHAWFAGYTTENRQDKPDIAIAVIAEFAGEGSEIAAPIFRRLVELYFYGRPLKIYRWEAAFDMTKTPTLPVTETPTPLPGQQPKPGGGGGGKPSINP